MYLFVNASINSLCLGESFLCSFVYYCLSLNKLYEDFTRSSSLKSWKVVRNTLIILVVDSTGMFGARILELVLKGLIFLFGVEVGQNFV